jgi:hypothetical protein
MVSLSALEVTPADVKYQVAHWEENRGPTIIATTSSFFFLALIFVALRFFTKWLRKVKFHHEDWLIAVAVVRIS